MRILFLCVQNAGRSQMAEAFARRLGKPGLEIYSAGSRPAAAVHPAVVEVMREKDIDLAAVRPKGLADLPEGIFDVVVGMGCGDVCPAARAKQVVAWEIPDPKDQPIERVREIRDRIEARVRVLMKRL